MLLLWSQQADFLRRFGADDGIGKAGRDFCVQLVDRCAATHDFRLALRQTGAERRLGIACRVDRLQRGEVVFVAGAEGVQQFVGDDHGGAKLLYATGTFLPFTAPLASISRRDTGSAQVCPGGLRSGELEFQFQFLRQLFGRKRARLVDSGDHLQVG